MIVVEVGRMNSRLESLQPILSRRIPIQKREKSKNGAKISFLFYPFVLAMLQDKGALPISMIDTCFLY